MRAAGRTRELQSGGDPAAIVTGPAGQTCRAPAPGRTMIITGTGAPDPGRGTLPAASAAPTLAPTSPARLAGILATSLPPQPPPGLPAPGAPAARAASP